MFLEARYFSYEQFTEQKWDFDKLAWVAKDAPIIRYDGTTLFFATNTHINPYNGSIVNYKTVTSDKVEHNIVLAFLAFIADEFANANYDVFLTHDNFIDDELISKVTPNSSTTVAPTTVKETTVAPTTVAPTTVAPTTVAPDNHNLALGTDKAFTMTGDGSENEIKRMYSTSKPVAKGTTFTVDFDITSTKADGNCMIQFSNTPWQVISSTPLKTGTQHLSYTLTADSDYSDGIQMRLDKSTSTVTISNFVLSESSKVTPTTVKKTTVAVKQA